jgi:hypothetical protein
MAARKTSAAKVPQAATKAAAEGQGYANRCSDKTIPPGSKVKADARSGVGHR